MATKAQEIVDREVTNRLNEIAFHFKQRDSVRSELESYRREDTAEDPPANKNIRELVTRMQNEELHILYELAHLYNNINRYFEAYGLNKSELEVVNKFKPFRVASNYVNTHKHGTRGGNRPSAKVDYCVWIFEQEGEKPKASDPICDVASLINYGGELYDCVELIESLIRIWDLFLKYHTHLDIQTFELKIGTVFTRRKDQTLYAGQIPEGVLKDAKIKADERKYLKF